MHTTDSRREGFDLPGPATASATRDAAQVPRSGRRAQMPQRWLIGLAGLAIAGVLLMAAALTGLGTVSTSVPRGPVASGFMGGHAAGAEALDAPGGPLCCHETK